MEISPREYWPIEFDGITLRSFEWFFLLLDFLPTCKRKNIVRESATSTIISAILNAPMRVSIT